jgi:hypothetical protein
MQDFGQGNKCLWPRSSLRVLNNVVMVTCQNSEHSAQKPSKRMKKRRFQQPASHKDSAKFIQVCGLCKEPKQCYEHVAKIPNKQAAKGVQVSKRLTDNQSKKK